MAVGVLSTKLVLYLLTEMRHQSLSRMWGDRNFIFSVCEFNLYLF